MGRAQLKKFTAKVDVSTARSSGRQPGFPSKEQLRGASVDLKDSAADGRVHFHLISYCTSLEPYGAPWTDEAGLSVRMLCETKPNPLFDLKNSMDKYCEYINKTQQWPGNFEELQNFYRFRFVYTDGTDQDGCGLFRRNAVTCYMPATAEIVQEWLVLMEDFISWRWTTEVKGSGGELPAIVIHNRADLPLELSDSENFKCSVTVEEAEDTGSHAAAGQGSGSYMGVRSVDVPPPVYPKRNVVWYLASNSEKEIDVTITGNCRAFAQGLNAAGVPCKLLKKNDSDPYYEKYYVLHDYDLTSAKATEFLLKDVLEGVFKSVPIAVRVAGPLTGEAQDFHKVLKGLPNIFPVD